MIDKNTQEKIEFSGIIRSVQPRSNVWRYRLDNRTHSMTGYNLFLSGAAEGTAKDFAVAISEKQMMKHRFHIGDEIKGTAWTKMYPKMEYADYYRAGGLKKLSEGPDPDEEAREPWTGEVPELSVYDWRGCRMLDSRSWKGKCFTCKWACMANVAIEYNWGVTQRWESPGQFLTKTAARFTMKAGLMIFALRIVTMKSDEMRWSCWKQKD